MNHFPVKKLLPYIAAILLYLILCFILFPSVIEGKRLRQGDITNHKGMSKEVVDYRESHGREALWTNSMFGGMPAYQISMISKANLGRGLDRLVRLGLPAPVWQVFLLFVGFFLLLVAMGVNPWLSLVGGLAFGFSSYFFIIIEAGHNSKVHAIAYMALVTAGVLMTYRKNWWLGGVIFALGLSLELTSNHLQITYYLMLMLLIYGVFEWVEALREKRIKGFLLRSLVLLGGVVIALMMNATMLLTTYEYGKESIRGSSELTLNRENQTSGLDKDYATQWSYGIAESWSVLIPNVKGGGTGLLAANEKAMDKVDRAYRQAVTQNQINHYWGDQPFTSGPVYVGAVVCFLFILGLFIVDGKYKWWLLSATLLSFMLAWGKNMMWFTDLMLDYFPGYNKFRAVSMTLVIAEFTMPLLGFLALKQLFEKPTLLNERRWAFPVALAATGGVALLFALLPGTFFSFFSKQELAMFGSLSSDYKPFIDSIAQARMAIFRADAWRTVLFVIPSAAVVYLFAQGKIKQALFIPLMALLVVADMAPIAKRYLNGDNFVSQRALKQEIPLTPASQYILKDKTIFRVLNVNNPFNDSKTSFFHQSVGGYHGAKLRRYQELIDHHLAPELENFIKILQQNPNSLAVSIALEKMKVVNMLNTRYLIYNPATDAIRNHHAMGNAWPVSRVTLVPNADKEIIELNHIDPSAEALVDERFAPMLDGYLPGRDTTATIALTTYEPNYLSYAYQSQRDQVVLFSEIYYDKGWNAYVDGEPYPYFRANYLLRAMWLPAGTHTVEWRFEPSSFRVGEILATVGSILLLLLLLGYVGYTVYKRRKATAPTA
ncbi:MAG: hypothetical protein CSA95_02440 [Bacteroidetes bacterium]|nr:MAG: hypothetical protein CSA95_02440 [Bacteroidota bacterium]